MDHDEPALHNASIGAGQFYTGCAQLFLKSNGNLGPETTVAIPSDAYAKAGDPSVHFNIYENKNDQYKPPGPAIANLVPFSNIAMGDTATSQSTQTQGLEPPACICENANWCGFEVPDYKDQQGCWASSQACWNHHDMGT